MYFCKTFSARETLKIRRQDKNPVSYHVSLVIDGLSREIFYFITLSDFVYNLSTIIKVVLGLDS